MTDHKHEDSFRVIDRRPFTAEGELRKEAIEEKEREQKREEQLHPVAEAPKPVAPQPPVEVPKRSQPFENLVRMLGSNAAMVLGAYARPHTASR